LGIRTSSSVLMDESVDASNACRWAWELSSNALTLATRLRIQKDKPAVKNNSTEDIETQANASHNEHESGILDPCRISVSRLRIEGGHKLCNDINLSTACNRMLIPRAKRSAPLKKAPNSGARCHPKARIFGGSSISESFVYCVSTLYALTQDHHPTFKADKATTNPIRSVNWTIQQISPGR
jgi:hypothetical protein